MPVAIEHGHVLAVASLPAVHHDPFDWLLAVQSRALDAPLLTADAPLADYPVQTVLIRS